MNILPKNKSSYIVQSSFEIGPLLQKLHRDYFDEIDRGKEKFFVAHLDTNNAVRTVEVVAIGTLTSCRIHPRETFRRAIHLNTCKIIIAHNHPSGQTYPSESDINITKTLVVAGKYLGIDVVEHIIFSDDDYYSFKDEGLI